MDRLPKVLEREPLVDALFEVRLDGTVPLADILPGFLFHELDPRPKITRLPAAELPQPMRANDPGLRYAPIQRLEWGDYIIAVGDRNIVISCRLPYPKWQKFKATILNVINRISKAGVAGKVERYSVKYVNLIEAPTLSEQIAKINLGVRIGPLEVMSDHINLQVHHVEGDIIHILTVITGAKGKMPDGREAYGVVVDIDSIRNLSLPQFSEFASELELGLDTLRLSNKVKFFGCLRQETIDNMGPIYE